MEGTLIGAEEIAPFSDFAPSLDEAFADAKLTGAPVLIQTSSRLDGTAGCGQN